jgi:hypothetical protein
MMIRIDHQIIPFTQQTQIISAICRAKYVYPFFTGGVGGTGGAGGVGGAGGSGWGIDLSFTSICFWGIFGREAGTGGVGGMGAAGFANSGGAPGSEGSAISPGSEGSAGSMDLPGIFGVAGIDLWTALGGFGGGILSFLVDFMICALSSSVPASRTNTRRQMTIFFTCIASV